jgi:hypothetical protein
MTEKPEVAYYYPAPFWGASEGAWVKSLLLFFDQVAILLPKYMHGRHTAADPTLAEPLEESGLLRILEPTDWITHDMAEKLTSTVIELLASGAFDQLQKTDYFAELSQSRLGYGVDFDLASWLVDELARKGLARPSEDGVSIPLHPAVRTTILVLLAQLARLRGIEEDMIVNPATNHNTAVSDLIGFLSNDKMPSASAVVAFDLEPVTLNLASVPLADVLGYRADHQLAHKTYMRDVRRFAEELSGITEPPEREAALLQRREELADAARELQKSARTSLGKNLAAWSFGLAGSWWSYSHGDPFGLLLAAIPGAAALTPDKSIVSAYSYVFGVGRSLSHG